MAFVIATTDKFGQPQCPICQREVDREGEFDRLECWDHFHTIIHEMGEVIEMDYLDVYEQPWYGKEHG